MGLSLPVPSVIRHASFGIGSPVLREALPTAASIRSAHRPRGGSKAPNPPESLTIAAEAIFNCPRPISVPIRPSTPPLRQMLFHFVFRFSFFFLSFLLVDCTIDLRY